jgi:diacylglycerol kinase family enzyme
LTVSDGERSVTCHSVVIANAAHYGGPYIIAPGADICAPVLEVVPLQTFTRSGFIRFALRLVLTGTAPKSPAGWQLRSGSLRVSGTKAVQVDGDDLGTGPLSISLIPDFNDIMM